MHKCCENQDVVPHDPPFKQVLVGTLINRLNRPFTVMATPSRPPLAVLAVPLKCHHHEECQSSATRGQKRFGLKVSLVLVDPLYGEQSTPACSQLSESVVIVICHCKEQTKIQRSNYTPNHDPLDIHALLLLTSMTSSVATLRKQRSHDWPSS